MAYVWHKSAHMRRRYVARPLQLRVALERNIAVTRALLPSFALYAFCSIATHVHIIVGYKLLEGKGLYAEV